jgi:hypothetical protein
MHQKKTFSSLERMKKPNERSLNQGAKYGRIDLSKTVSLSYFDRLSYTNAVIANIIPL